MAFLDVDDLDDIARLDEYIAQSALMLLFVSANYFGSRACQAEIKSTLKWRKPIMLLHEADPNHGGKPWAEFVAECPETLEAEGVFGALPDEYVGKDGVPDVVRWTKEGWFDADKREDAPTIDGTVAVRARVLADGNEVVRWHRIRDFQLLSLTRIAFHALRANGYQAIGDEDASSRQDRKLGSREEARVGSAY